MNGAQDMGGTMGFGPVAPEPDEPLFHAAWERRVFALTLAMGATGTWTIDESRHARERLHPARYLASTYYQLWLAGLETLLARHGLASQDEVAAGRRLEPTRPVKRVLRGGEVAAALARGSPSSRASDAPPRFAVGDRVRARNAHPQGHTRLPRYARGRLGEVVLDHGVHVLADASAAGRLDVAERLYTVRFAGTELWGQDADPTLRVSIDAWESYLEPAA